MLMDKYPSMRTDNSAASKKVVSLSVALDMCDSGEIDIVKSYKNAASTLELVTNFYTELMRKSNAHEKSKC
jgi:hypothetical protein